MATMRVYRKGFDDPVTIEAEDFNEKTDSEVSEADEAKDANDLSGMTKAELLDVAASRGVEISSSATKGEIIDALNAAG